MTQQPLVQPTPQELDRIRVQAQALILARKREGKWSGGLVPHPYQTHPLEWMVEVLGIPEHTIRWSLNEGYDKHPWDGDPDPMVLVLDAIAGGDSCGVESATGTGKTFLAAAITLWFLGNFENSLVITSAPKEEQLLTQVWKEIAVLWPRFKRHFPTAELFSGKIRMKQGDEKDTWTAMAFVAGVGADEDAAQKAAGFHRQHMLIITEDTPGIDQAIMTAFGHTRTDDHNLHLALGNPDHRNDTLHRFCFDETEKLRAGIRHVRISALDHPNVITGRSVIPGAIGKRRLAERTAEWGVGTRFYQSRIRGISPAEAEDALIKWEWCVRASEKYNDPAYRLGKPALGVDVANSEAGDQAAIARWQGACLTEVEAFQCPDAGLLGEQVVFEARDPENPVSEKNVGVDDVGVGASTVNAARRMRFRVRRLGGATKAIASVDEDAQWSVVAPDDRGGVKPAGPVVVDAERFDRLRSKILWRMREDLRLERIALPVDPELWRDLCTATYTTKNGQICVETKESIKKRLKRSPNKGEAAAYGNFVRDRSLPMEKRREVPRSTSQRDYRLEKMIAQNDKLGKAEERRIKRLLRGRGRRLGR